MKNRILAACIAGLLLLAGCGGGANGGAEIYQAATSAPQSPNESWTSDSGNYWDMSSGGEAEFSPPASEAGVDSGSSIYQNPGAKLIRRAELTIQTEQFDQSVEALNHLTAECGGYYENASIYGGSRRDVNASRHGEYVVRVPAEKYEQFLSSAGNLGYVTSKNESSENIGERYYDTEARLKTQRTKQERLLALLERAETMDDIIALESALSEVEYQIEQYSSELNRYDALVGFATFTVSLSEVGRVTQEVGETASLGQRMAAGVQASFRNLGQGVQNFLIWISYNLFLAVILAAASVVAVIVGKRELKKRNGADKKTEER